ncbi:DNA (cytosine-5-)-methyltransferase [Vibrio sp. V31_P5A7T61]|nr:DNA (cytosine-5-)-methyltransferase [Vibrio sp. V31_P5A7T61]NAX02328.1 DNA (cytosine-5-)-methyltransferase [Vibrio sp. V34_P3A8T189]NAX08885.1 DNA (cytosine-5-)-methyltransferase [Vibrio sp. V40_P2S30T141]NAX63618.1 DNA (cytosine-5-)-methyltransferase [Vibrio sp. V32_P6A28T40]NOI06657.1 DNA cytosine methyltransferase [Vibrio anguillarum]
MKSNPRIVDLFCGCGGFGLGAELAGFKTIAAIDIDPTLQSAYKKNFPETHVLNGDLSQLNEESWRMILNGIEVDGVIGGPPCQGYSRMGKSDKEDPRRTLLGHFFRNVNIINPSFFIMENVEGLMDERNVYELENALQTLDKKYKVLKPMIVDASLYGAPTKRKRVILIGYDPKRLSSLTIDDFQPQNGLKTTVRDAISDLAQPIVQNKDKEDFGWEVYPENNELSVYAQRMRTLPNKSLGWGESLEKLSNGFVSGYFDTKHTAAVKKRYAETEPGMVDKVSRAKKLAWDGLCPTLRAGTGSDKGSHQAVRPLHPSHSRVITVREAARLQGFPDWFVFHPTKWHSFRMIGNSVSPIVSEAILSKIKQKLDEKNSSRKVV